MGDTPLLNLAINGPNQALLPPPSAPPNPSTNEYHHGKIGWELEVDLETKNSPQNF